MRNFTPTRRAVMLGALTAPLAATLPRAIAQDAPDLAKLKPGEFIWTPERAPSGPVVVVVSIPDQRVAVYRNGMMIGAATCSTGKPGHTTPSGVFVILEKDRNHHSSTYNNAPMPYMERLTWQGVALHAGNLPGYPASHGCIRLPLEFAKLLFGVTTLGTPVVVADSKMATADIRHPGLLISEHVDAMAHEAVKTVAAKPHHPEAATTQTHEAAAFVISTADKRLLAFRQRKGSIRISGRVESTGEIVRQSRLHTHRSGFGSAPHEMDGDRAGRRARGSIRSDRRIDIEQGRFATGCRKARGCADASGLHHGDHQRSRDGREPHRSRLHHHDP